MRLLAAITSFCLFSVLALAEELALQGPLLAPPRPQELIDLLGDPGLVGSRVIVETDPDPLQVKVGAPVMGGPPNTLLQVQFEGFKEGTLFHWQVCTFRTNAGGTGSCLFENARGGAAEIRRNIVPLGPNGIVTSGVSAFIGVCPFSVPREDAPDIYVSFSGFPGFPDRLVVP